MNMRNLLGLLSLALGLASLSTGCGASLEVVRQQTPNPFVKQKDFYVAPVQFVNLTVDGEPESAYKASLDSNTDASWEADKKAIKALFPKSLKAAAAEYGIHVTDSPSSAPFDMKPVIGMIETGYYRIPAWNAVTRIRMDLVIKDKAGAVLDEIIVEDSAAFDALLAPSIGGRLRTVAKALGALVAEYLDGRVNG